jgi:hypothetical protein
MSTDDSTTDDPVTLAYRLLVVLRVAVAVLLGLATLGATLGWL